MKESSEDTMIKNIKEVLEKYEPDYSPQFWENLRKQRPDAGIPAHQTISEI